MPPGLAPLAWIAALVGASILYRGTRGKPILFFGVPDASYQQRSASGRSNRNWLTKLGGARNCLVVAVAKSRLVVSPWFPFNLMFLPEIYGLECDVPVESIVSTKVRKWMFREELVVEYRDEDGQIQSVCLQVRDPRSLNAALGQAGLSQERQGA